MDGSEVALAPAESKPPTKLSHHFAASPIVTVSVGKEQVTYRTHKDILIERCPFFAKMFDSGMSEAHTNHVQLPEDSHAAFEQFLSWILL
ncbi:hypothetical protein CLCR_11043 [Cladophialophora carrionii]|uniref:BTB domain-containing protein n=1 Tax=Cladophialophora carrionii TaxID=86049 RepID=A0A1C1CX50_9EURO|nr:hypothetical protein CLCR_11043 [Cladophialophora carrionii]